MRSTICFIILASLFVDVDDVELPEVLDVDDDGADADADALFWVRSA
jgi:hypothetical protein